jgi:alpha-beta hydrolase superfamily lysophospholipase
MVCILPDGFDNQGFFQSRDGLKLHYYQRQVAEPEFYLVAIHGMGEHAGRYGWLANQVAAEGGSFSCLDLRGHGLSEGQRGHSPNYPQLLEDVADFIDIQHEGQDRPLFLFGHSLGGGLALNYALEADTYCKDPIRRISGVIASSPLLRLAFQPPTWKLFLARKLVKSMPSFSLNRGIKPWLLTRDENARISYKADSLVHERVSAALTIGFFDAGESALAKANELQVPALILHGETDQVTSIDASIEFAEKAGEKADFKSFPNCYHELINEPERDQVAATILSWIQERQAHQFGADHRL